MKKCRYKGPGLHIMNGMPIDIGTVVTLSDAAAKAFQDRFEVIEDMILGNEGVAEPVLSNEFFAIIVKNNLFDIYSITSEKKMNEKPMKRKEIVESFPDIEIYRTDECPYAYELWNKKEEKPKMVKEKGVEVKRKKLKRKVNK